MKTTGPPPFPPPPYHVDEFFLGHVLFAAIPTELLRGLVLQHRVQQLSVPTRVVGDQVSSTHHGVATTAGVVVVVVVVVA